MSINISKDNTTGDCNTKCAYSFDYKECELSATNNFYSIVFDIDPIPSVPPVIYNNQKYTPYKIFISSPSRNRYEGSVVDAEIMISHFSVGGGGDLTVYIPIIQSTDTSAASILITQMITDVAKKAPNNGNTIANVSGIANFSLNTIIPKAPFYSYSSDDSDFIVFGLPSAIPISNSVLDGKLKKILRAYPSPPEDTEIEVFYNSVGPKSSLADQGIYIDCQPTGSSGEVEVAQTRNPPIYDLDTILKDPTLYMILQLLMSCLIFLIIYFLISYGFAFMTSTGTKAVTK
jgi:hypothetical protein